MRISTGTIYDAGVGSMQQQSGKLLQVQQQIASGKRIVTPADDPVGTARAFEVSQSQAINTQYIANNGTAADNLGLEEAILGGVTDLLQNVREISLYAGNPVLSKNDRRLLAGELRNNYEALLRLANSTDGGGQYLFSGYQGAVPPFSETAPGVISYNGDQGQRLVQVSPSRQLAVSDAGSDVFQRILTGNGSFSTQAGANIGAAVIDNGAVLDPLKWSSAANSKDYTIRFALSGGATSYDIIDNVSGKSLLTGLAPGTAPLPRAYSSGSNIDLSQAGAPAFDYGARISISGLPADGDSFTIMASTNKDVFSTVNDLVELLQTAGGSAALTNGLATMQSNLDRALDKVIAVRASAGARLKELDALKIASDDRALQYSQTLSRLEDLDYAKAIAELAQQQVSLDAAQKSFVKVAGISLFSYL